MTDAQWDQLLHVLAGEQIEPLPVGFLVDAPWVAGIHGVPLRRYFLDGPTWRDANRNAVQRFPDVLWMPGFWGEFGMISNPPSFGCKCVWPEDGFPSCERVLHDVAEIDRLAPPNVRTDGLLPLIIERQSEAREAIEQAGHRIRFAASHGPLTIAAYVLGHTEFFLGMRTAPEAIQRLLRLATDFIVAWLRYQQECFPTIAGILVLEDFLGFIGDADFRTFGLPYMQEIFAAMDVSVRFLHNDAAGLITARYLEAMGVNLFNFSFAHDVGEIRSLAGERVTLLGNIPPRDVLALGSVEDVRRHVGELLRSLGDRRRVIVSAGGFTPAQFNAEKIAAFCQAVREG